MTANKLSNSKILYYNANKVLKDMKDFVKCAFIVASNGYIGFVKDCISMIKNTKTSTKNLYNICKTFCFACVLSSLCNSLIARFPPPPKKKVMIMEC